MNSFAELRSALSEAGSIALVLGPLSSSPRLGAWLADAGPASATVFDSPPFPVAAFDRVIDLRAEARPFIEDWFAQIFPESLLARQLAPAAGLIEEALVLGVTSIADPALTRAPGFARFEAELFADNERAFLDFARILALVWPRPIQIGDEWVHLASQMGSRSWSIADLTVLMRDGNHAFAVTPDGKGNDVAVLSSPFIAQIVASRVKMSTSEHYALFRALRDMAVQSLQRDDAGDRFVKTELPLQAEAGDAIEEFCDDGMALLASDSATLIRVVEKSRKISQGAKLVLRAAHRFDEVDTLSQLELAARRGSMLRLADDIAQGSPPRPWRPVWATSQPVNTNRVIFLEAANVVCLVADLLDEEICYAGLTNGAVFEVSRHAEQRRVWAQTPHASEVRAIATLVIEGKTLLFTAHSDQGIRAIEPGEPEPRWEERSIMKGPLSAIAAASSPEGGLVAAGGVDGVLAILDARTGKQVMEPIQLEGEIRGIEILSDVVLVCLVNGEAIALERKDGSMRWRVAVGIDDVCNALAAIETAEGLYAVVGTTTGRLHEVEATGHGAPTTTVLQDFHSSINSVGIGWTGDTLTVVAGLSDASWVKWQSGEDRWRRYLGHVGSVNAILIGDEGRVTTGSGEGTVRTWLPRFVDAESAILEWGVRHRGPVTGISIDLAASHGEVTLITGGADGTVRAWSGPTDTTGVRIAAHDSAVRALVWDPVAEKVFVGHSDGLLRTVTRTPAGWETRLVGIQHDGVRGLALSPAGRLYSAGVDGTVTSWNSDLSAAGAKTEPISDFGYVAAIGWLNQLVAVGGQDGKVHLLNPDSLQPVKTVDLGASVTSIVGHDGDLFVGLTTGSLVILRSFDEPSAPGPRGLPVHGGEVRGIQAFELGGNLVIATTGLDRRIVLTDLRTEKTLAEIALDGFGLGIHADPPYLAISTTSGAMVVELSTELPGFVGARTVLSYAGDRPSRPADG